MRIELRKVETLPGGGLANTFFDFVGQSPVNLWQSGDEYSMLTTVRSHHYRPVFKSTHSSYSKTSNSLFVFQNRYRPVSRLRRAVRTTFPMPSSSCLINASHSRHKIRAYCYTLHQGQEASPITFPYLYNALIVAYRGFLRRDKHVVLSTSAPIIIDKHELHSTWPVYVQPETRKVDGSGVMLVVERTNTCYGPGDRISVMALVKSETLQTVVLRGFEFSLRETIVFRAGPNTVGKKAAPQVKTGNVSEQKVPMNVQLYSGMQHRAELAITVPAHHTSTTLNAARHIDITYVLTVKALMGTGQTLTMDLPIIVSNWPRYVDARLARSQHVTEVLDIDRCPWKQSGAFLLSLLRSLDIHLTSL